MPSTAATPASSGRATRAVTLGRVATLVRAWLLPCVPRGSSHVDAKTPDTPVALRRLFLPTPVNADKRAPARAPVAPPSPPLVHRLAVCAAQPTPPRHCS